MGKGEGVRGKANLKDVDTKRINIRIGHHLIFLSPLPLTLFPITLFPLFPFTPSPPFYRFCAIVSGLSGDFFSGFGDFATGSAPGGSALRVLR